MAFVGRRKGKYLQQVGVTEHLSDCLTRSGPISELSHSIQSSAPACPTGASWFVFDKIVCLRYSRRFPLPREKLHFGMMPSQI